MKKQPININIQHLVKEIKVETVPGSTFTQDQLDKIEREVVRRVCLATEFAHQIANAKSTDDLNIPNWLKEKFYRNNTTLDDLKKEVADTIKRVLHAADIKGIKPYVRYNRPDSHNEYAAKCLEAATINFNKAIKDAKKSGLDITVSFDPEEDCEIEIDIKYDRQRK